MFDKIQRKSLGIKCAIDICQYENGVFCVKGWMFSDKQKMQRMQLVVEVGRVKYPVDISSHLKRSDVYREFQMENAKKCGFYGEVRIENVESFSVNLVSEFGGQKNVWKLGKYKADEKVDPQKQPNIEGIDIGDKEIEVMGLIASDKLRDVHCPDEYKSELIDVIVPVYNGYQYFDALFSSIEKTEMKYRLIILNDCSPDERVLPYLKEYAGKHSEVILVENETNLGFVKNVNKALELAKGHHVALVNSDVELPELWLERLMLPILESDDVASSTPYTNCGTLVSFPKMGEDNGLFKDFTLAEIDEEFQKIVPRYASLPTGVGFCMGMSKNAIEKVGVLDADSFGMGYGEENDWCQRAILAGYRNVQVENLFVYHKHGGSFLSEDKKRYLEEHAKILSKKHPTYNKQVAHFFAVDPNKDIRKLVKYRLLKKSESEKVIVAFDHDIGGGATSYLNNKQREYLDKGYVFYVVRYNYVQDYYQIFMHADKDKYEFYVKTQEELMKALQFFGAKELWINELVTYPTLYKLLERIEEYRAQNEVKLIMLLHDYFAICPTINLVNSDKKYCAIPECTQACKHCFANVHPDYVKDYQSMEEWRNRWGHFLERCDSILVFSNDSDRLLEKAYGKLDNVKVIPHQIGFMPKLDKKYKTTDTFNIGLLGILNYHKGAEIVKELLKEIERRGMNVRVVLIGYSAEPINSPLFSETGRYAPDSIPALTLKHDIDMFLIPSIWPETFCYTAEEIMKMSMPIMCFNIGAPVERVINYEKGMIVDEMSGAAVADAIEASEVMARSKQMERKEKSVLFIAGEESFASRYRVSHLREQLLMQGISSKCIMVDKFKRCNFKPYQSVVLYRVADQKVVHKIIKQAHKAGKEVYYDIDDYIFNYENIKHLSFLKGKEYKNFEAYSKNIKEIMASCDGYIVSTNTLKDAILKDFPGKPVCINRNVSSLAMQICSLRRTLEKKNDKVYLGYFSGTKTHNADFEKIKQPLLNLMQKNENVCLLVGGQITLPEEFNVYKDRIERFKLIIWKKLPALIAKADINLMPLEDTFFHACKSENKWMEAALVHVPTVASWNQELQRAIENGVDGYLCKSEAEWEETLEQLVESEMLRKQIADAAFRKVMDKYTTFHVEKDVVDMLTK